MQAALPGAGTPNRALAPNLEKAGRGLMPKATARPTPLPRPAPRVRALPVWLLWLGLNQMRSAPRGPPWASRV